MDTQVLLPQHEILGTKPEPIAQARTKVVIGIICLSLSAVLMIYQDTDQIRRRLRTIKTQVVKNSKPARRPEFSLL